MKIACVIVDASGQVFHKSVINGNGTDVVRELLKSNFSNGGKIDQIFAEHNVNDMSLDDAFEWLSQNASEDDNKSDEENELVEDLSLFEITDDSQQFLSDLKSFLDGETDELEEVAETQTMVLLRVD